MTFTPPDLSDVLTNETTMYSRLTTFRNDVKDILDETEITYSSDLGILGLLRLLPVPNPQSIEFNCYGSWLTKDGPQAHAKSANMYIIVRDKNDVSMNGIDVVLQRKPLSGGNWTTITSGKTPLSYTATADANRGGYIYKAYVTNKPSVSAEHSLLQYYMNYFNDSEYVDNIPPSLLNTSNLLKATNVKSVDTTGLTYEENYIEVVANQAGVMKGAIMINNTPTILGANSNTHVYIGYDMSRGNVPSSTQMKGYGGGFVGNGSRDSVGVFFDNCDVDFDTAYDFMFLGSPSDAGYTVAGSVRECYVDIEGGSSGNYTYYKTADGSVSHYAGYWYGSEIGSTYAPCIVFYADNMAADERLRIPIKYIRAVAP